MAQAEPTNTRVVLFAQLMTALQTFASIVRQPELLGLINQCLSSDTADIVEGGTVCPTNLHDTCVDLREATKRGLRPLRLATRSLQLYVGDSPLQRELAAQLEAQTLAGGPQSTTP